MAVDGIPLNLNIVLGPNDTLGRGPDAPDAGTAELPCRAGREEVVPKSEIGLKVARFRLATFTLSWRAGIRSEAEDVQQ